MSKHFFNMLDRTGLAVQGCALSDFFTVETFGNSAAVSAGKSRTHFGSKWLTLPGIGRNLVVLGALVWGYQIPQEVMMISSRANVERALKQCSFSQSWVGGMICDGQQTVRPALLVFASESGSQMLASELVPQPLDLCRVGIWLDKCFALHGPPQELLVPNLEVLESIRYRYPSTRLRVQPASQVLQDSIHTLTADFREHVPHSLVKRLGETKAAELFQAAHSFTQARPWRSLQDNVVVRFGVGQVDYYLMLGGYCRENEQGIYLFRSLADILEELLMASYSPAGSLFVHHRDLNLVDKLGLALERQKYPMFMAEEMPPGKAVLKDLLWLLRRLPDFAKDQMPVEDGSRRLAVTEERVDHWFGRSGSWTQAFNSAA